MKYVLDASVALKRVLPEPDAIKALALRDDYLAGIHDLRAPDTFAVEIAHGLTGAERRGILVPPAATNCVQNVLAAAPRFHSFLALLTRATELSSQHRIGVYDCLYVALAEQEQCSLVTTDGRLATSGLPSIELLSSLP